MTIALLDRVTYHSEIARRNELLAELFQRSHRIEKWGRGIKMIPEREPATEFEENHLNKESRWWNMSRICGKDTKPEIAVRENVRKSRPIVGPMPRIS